MKKTQWLLAPLPIMMKHLKKLCLLKNQLVWISLNMDIGNNMKTKIIDWIGVILLGILLGSMIGWGF